MLHSVLISQHTILLKIIIPSSSMTALQKMTVVLTVADNEAVTEEEGVAGAVGGEEEIGGAGDIEINGPQDVKIGRMEVGGS